MTEDEFRTGKGPTFEASRNVAKAIQEGKGAFDYIAEARLTCSPAWHGDKVAKSRFIGCINAAIDAAQKLDQVKKTLFYGRDNGLHISNMPAVKDVPLMFGDMEPEVTADIIHGIIGVFTEAGELLEAMREALNEGKPFDGVNLMEECGDIFWYIAIIAFRCGFTFEGSQRINIQKLRARFPDRFTEYDANNRNLSAERAILEGGAEAK